MFKHDLHVLIAYDIESLKWPLKRVEQCECSWALIDLAPILICKVHSLTSVQRVTESTRIIELASGALFCFSWRRKTVFAAVQMQASTQYSDQCHKRKYVHEVLVNRLITQACPGKSVIKVN